ncbi:MAG: hypothetical protein ACOCXT_04430 [Candidatus Dojkabacteria bacterium]
MKKSASTFKQYLETGEKFDWTVERIIRLEHQMDRTMKRGSRRLERTDVTNRN